MHGPYFAIPRQVDVPLHVRVKREDLAFVVVGVIVGIAKSSEQQGEGFSTANDPEQRSARCRSADRMASGVHVPIEQL